MDKEKMLNRMINGEVTKGCEMKEIERLRKICWEQQKSILDLQNKLSKYEDFNQWQNIEYFRDWSDRAAIMANLISDKCQSILDLGCGEGHIKKFLKANVVYYGCDYVKRSEDTIVCDLSVGEFPELVVDTIFIAGVLEYIKKWESVLEQSCLHSNQIVMSYSTREAYPDRNPIFVNNISEGEIISVMEKNKFRLVKKCELPYNSIGFSFERNN